MYLGYQGNKIKFYTETKLDIALYNIDKVEETQEEYIFDGEEYVLKDEAWEEKQAQKERERLNNLSMTRGDVFEALILARGLTKPQIRAMIEQAELDDITKALYLNRFDEALDFYRGFPVFDMLGKALDVTPKQLDDFFETKDYHYLTTVVLEVKANVENAIVRINNIETNKLKKPYNDEVIEVTYIVEKDGYKTVKETIQWDLKENKVIEVELGEDTSINT